MNVCVIGVGRQQHTGPGKEWEDQADAHFLSHFDKELLILQLQLHFLYASKLDLMQSFPLNTN